MAEFLTKQGFDSVHTLDLPNGNATSDEEINEISVKENRIVITKDSGFVDSHLLRNEPPSLVLVSAGNIGNRDLLVLFERHLDEVAKLLDSHSFIELHNSYINIHGDEISE